MEWWVLLALTSCFAVTEVRCRDAKWLNFACNPDTHEYSVVNPDPENYHYALVKGGKCTTSFTEDYKAFNISSCLNNGTLSVVLSHKFDQSASLYGGRLSKTYLVNCLMKQYSPMLELKVETQAEFREDNSSDVFAESEPKVDLLVRDLQGVQGYSVFTVGYPLTLELVGPAGSKMLPKACVAYAGEVGNSTGSKKVIKDGCSTDKGLIFDFSENVTNWFDLGLAIPDLSELLLSEPEADEGEEEEKEEEAEEDRRQKLQATMYGFRFYNSKKVVLHCDVDLCLSGSDGCDFKCDDD